MMRHTMFALVLALGLTGTAFADDGTEQEPSKTDTSATPSHADPATKTLPATASATAKANAFGQQGARMKAAHQAAKAAAADAAKQAAADHRPASAGTPNSHANAHAAGASHAATGLEHAATASGGHAHH